MLRRFIVCLTASVALSGCVLYAPVDLGSLGGPGELRETLLEGTTGPKIVLLEISGEISDLEDRANFSLTQRPSIVAETKNVLERAAADDDVVALLLRINSPGGSVSASDTLYHEIKAWKDENKKPVFAFFNGISASGAYYAAMAADHIVSHPAAVTGSIGVVMPGLSIEGLMEKYGVADQTLTSGPYKDAGSLFRDMRPEERKQLQSVIDDLYRRFTSVVAQGRPGLDAARIHTLADGRVYSADQALAAGLVDELGYLEDTVAAIQKRAGISESRVVVYHRSNSVRENIYSRALGAPDLSLSVLELGLASLRRSALAPGFYYLWPAALTR